jgi:hypothetical protein
VSELGAIFYRGPSLLTGDPIVGIVTGLEGHSMNPKTGPMAQAWILRPDLAPMEAVRQNLDDAICGDCALRGRDGRDRTCYVVPWFGANNIYRLFRDDRYLEATWPELQALVEGQHLRIAAYGDPAAVPYDVWRMLLITAGGWTAYTHQWRQCDPRLKAIAMASVDNDAERAAAWSWGWRTFRVRHPREALVQPRQRTHVGAPKVLAGEIVCPASDEAGHRTTCDRCQLCRGNNRPARSIAIVAHGHNGALTAFYKNHAAAQAIA